MYSRLEATLRVQENQDRGRNTSATGLQSYGDVYCGS
ncbi:unnamed protein product, partial [Allacma fusca]